MRVRGVRPGGTPGLATPPHTGGNHRATGAPHRRTRARSRGHLARGGDCDRQGSPNDHGKRCTDPPEALVPTASGVAHALHVDTRGVCRGFCGPVTPETFGLVGDVCVGVLGDAVEHIAVRSSRTGGRHVCSPWCRRSSTLQSATVDQLPTPAASLRSLASAPHTSHPEPGSGDTGGSTTCTGAAIVVLGLLMKGTLGKPSWVDETIFSNILAPTSAMHRLSRTTAEIL